MYISADGLFNIEVLSTPCGAFQTSDWSIVNIPYDKTEVDNLIAAYSNMDVDRHLTLVLCRHKDDYMLPALAMVNTFATQTNMKYIQELCLTYEGTTRRNGARLTTVSEAAFLLCKGEQTPDYTKTTWFNKDFANATNHWDVSKHTHDGYKEPISKTKFGLFSWEIGLLMVGLSLPRQTDSFVYIGNPNDISLISFVKLFAVKCFCYWSKEADASEALMEYESFKLEK